MKNAPKKAKEVKEALYRELITVDRAVLNGSLDGSDYILNMSFPGVRSEILLHSLEAKGIYVSAGSACASNKPQPSNTLTKMGKTPQEIDSAIRFSFSVENTPEEAKQAAEAVKKEVEQIRKYTRA